MSVYNVLKDVNNLEAALKCKVCNNLLEDPLLIAKCGHTVCKHCFTEHFDMKCPVCDIPMNTKDSLEDEQIRNILLHLKKLKGIIQDETNTPETKTFQSVSKGSKTEQRTVSGEDVSSTKKDTPENLHSTPKIRRKSKLLPKVKAPVPASSRKESIIQVSPENASVKRIFTPATKRQTSVSSSEKRKLSSSVSSSKILTQSPANLNKKNHKGETLLHRTVIKGDIEKVKSLLEEGVLVNTQDNNGWTPLHEASSHGYLEIAKLLVDHGALVNVPSLKDNITPLHDALINEKLPMAILLVSRGADLYAKTCLGNTALDLCKSDEDRNILIESCSPFISANMSLSSTKVTEEHSDKLILLSTSLNDEQKAKLHECAKMLKAEVVDTFVPEVTHLVTSCDKMGNCTRTLKVLMGILAGKWIVNFQWIEVCLEYKYRVEEAVFEVQGMKNKPNTQGPKHSRENMQLKYPPLFDGFYFYLHGQYTKPTPEREDLCNLINLGGGKILAREPRPETVASEQYKIPYHASGTPLEDINHIILYQDKPPRDIHLHSNHICTTQVMWLVECISEFKLLDVKQTNPSEK